MKYIATADSDIGIKRTTNQDSVLIKHAAYEKGSVMMAIVCDGMGGLAKGEVASATVIKKFSEWFSETLPYELDHLDMRIIGEEWSFLLKEVNVKINVYGQKNRISLGTTFSGLLLAEDQYLIVHVGDSRIYHIGGNITQLTEDQTFIAREIKRGTMTLEQAKTDKRRNLLLQCVGASDELKPQIQIGKAEPGAYLLCSDGFRHVITEQEIRDGLKPADLVSQESMHQKIQALIELNKQRKETDNISAVLVKVMA